VERTLTLSSSLSFVAGLVLRKYDRERQGRRKLDPKRLTGIQVAYSVLLAYPVCVFYVWVHRNLDGWLR